MTNQDGSPIGHFAGTDAVALVLPALLLAIAQVWLAASSANVVMALSLMGVYTWAQFKLSRRHGNRSRAAAIKATVVWSFAALPLALVITLSYTLCVVSGIGGMETFLVTAIVALSVLVPSWYALGYIDAHAYRYAWLRPPYAGLWLDF